MDGIVERHYLKCPFCPDGRANLETHKCKCGATAVKIEWVHESPELALIARSNKDG